MVSELFLAVISLDLLQCYLHHSTSKSTDDARSLLYDSSYEAFAIGLALSGIAYLMAEKLSRKVVASFNLSFFMLSLGLYLVSTSGERSNIQLLKWTSATCVSGIYYDMVKYRWKVSLDTFWSVYVVFGIVYRSLGYINEEGFFGGDVAVAKERHPLIVGDIAAFCTVLFGIITHAILPFIRGPMTDNLVVNIKNIVVEMIFLASLISVLYIHLFTAIFMKVYAQTPIRWLFEAISHPQLLWLSTYWVGVISLSIFVAGRSLSSQILCRKIFHFAAALIFIPGLFDSSSSSFVFLAVSLSIAVCFLFVIEMCRNTLICTEYLFEHVFVYYKKFLDERDIHHNIILSHIYLLLGSAMPVWYFLHYKTTIFKVCSPSSSLVETPSVRLLGLVRYFGVLSVCVGDSVGALVGVSFGKHKWKSTKLGLLMGLGETSIGNRSVEGSIGVLLSTLISFLVIFGLAYSMHKLTVLDMAALIALSIVAAVTEAFSSSNDNLMMPYTMIVTASVLFICIV